ncbi:MAG: hypothetical protein AAB229_01180 [Candidatus Hydrogenedentota bacterium]
MPSGANPLTDNTSAAPNSRWTAPRKITLFAIVALALAIRLVAIDWGLPDSSHRWPYHPDESNLFVRTREAVLGLRPLGLAHGITFFGIYGTWTVAGAGLGLFPLHADAYVADPSHLYGLYLWNRILTVLISTATVVLVFAVSQQLGLSQESSALAAFFQTILPFAVLHAKYLTPHSANAALFLLAILLHLRRSHPSLISFAALLTTACEYALAPLWFVLLIAERGEDKSRLHAYLAIGLAGVALFANILVDPSSWFATLKGQSHFFNILGLGPIDLAGIMGPAASYTILAAGTAGLALLSKRRRARPTIMAVAVTGLALLALGSPFSRRYAPLYPFLAIGAAKLVEWIPLRSPVRVFLVLLLIVEPAARCISLTTALIDSDTRSVARTAIESAIAPDSGTIALQNWFFAPHLSMNAYQFQMLDAHGEGGGSARFILTTEFNRPDPRTLRPPRYRSIVTVERHHTFAGFVFDDRSWPEDLRYANPGIWLFEDMGTPEVIKSSSFE